MHVAHVGIQRHVPAEELEPEVAVGVDLGYDHSFSKGALAGVSGEARSIPSSETSSPSNPLGSHNPISRSDFFTG